jgi:multiple sugar transport system permease protein
VFGVIETVSSCGTVPSLTCLVVGTFQSGRYATAAAVAFITAAIVGSVAMIYIVKFADLEVGQ